MNVTLVGIQIETFKYGPCWHIYFNGGPTLFTEGIVKKNSLWFWNYKLNILIT